MMPAWLNWRLTTAVLVLVRSAMGWVPPGKTRSITADEVHYGVLDCGRRDRGFSYFYFRDDVATAAMVEGTPGEFREPQDSDNYENLIELKQAIIAAGLNPFRYTAQWDTGSRRLTGLKEFGDRVYNDLLDGMKSDPELQDRFVTDTTAQLDEFADENAAMEAFVAERSERFVLGSRGAVLEELLAYASSTGGNGYICLTGAPGSGKSSLLAHLSEHSALSARQSTVLIRHFVGVSPGSTDVRRTLRRLCHELKAGCSDITADIPDDSDKLRVAFPEFLRQACVRRRVVILLDAINQFDPASHSPGLRWLPEELPANARVVLSALDGLALEELRRRPHKPRELELKPLTADDGEAIIGDFGKRYRKQFGPGQRAALLAKTDAATPLYLVAALEELRTLGTFEEITKRIAELPPRTQELFAWILERLENDGGFRNAAGEPVGHDLVRRFAALLGVSRYGLSQRELADLLDPGDSQGNIGAFLHLLRPYLMRRGTLLDFYHSQFREAAKEAWLKTEAERLACHAQLAGYFRDQADPGRDTHWKGKDARPFAELPFHEIEGQLWSELEATLGDPDFLQAKAVAIGFYDVLSDMLNCLDRIPAQNTARAAISSMHSALDADSYLLRTDPSLLIQQAYNTLIWDWGEATTLGRKLRSAVRDPLPSTWLKRRNRPQTLRRPAPLRVLPEHADQVTCLAFSYDEKLIATGSRAGVITVWDLSTGRPLRKWSIGCEVRSLSFTSDASILAVLDENWSVALWDPLAVTLKYSLPETRQIWCAVISPDDTSLVTATSEDELVVWDLNAGAVRRRIPAHVTQITFSPDGQMLAGCGIGSDLVVWDVPTFRIRWSSRLEIVGGYGVKAMRGIEVMGGSKRLAFSPDGRQLAVANHSSAMLWDAHEGQYRWLTDGVLVGERPRYVNYAYQPINGLCFSPDGRFIAAQIDEGLEAGVSFLETATGKKQELLPPGHVNPVGFSPSGAVFAVASKDRTVELWPSRVASRDVLPAGLDAKAASAAFSPDGCSLAVGGRDHTIRLIDVATGNCIRMLGKHPGPVAAVAWASNGQYLASGNTCKNEVPLIMLWDTHTGGVKWSLTSTQLHYSVRAIAVSPDARIIASGGVVGAEAGGVDLWDAGTGQLCRQLYGVAIPIKGLTFSPGVGDLAFSPDGGTVATSSGFDGDLRLWDIRTGEISNILCTHTRGIPCAAFSPDGNSVAVNCFHTAQYNTTSSWIMMFDRQSGLCKWSSDEYGGVDCVICFSPDGRLLASGGGDGRLRLLDARSGRLLTQVPCMDIVLAVWFSPDSQELRVADARVLAKGQGIYIFGIICNSDSSRRS